MKVFMEILIKHFKRKIDKEKLQVGTYVNGWQNRDWEGDNVVENYDRPRAEGTRNKNKEEENILV